jgi:hypothetical protein
MPRVRSKPLPSAPDVPSSLPEQPPEQERPSIHAMPQPEVP